MRITFSVLFEADLSGTDPCDHEYKKSVIMITRLKLNKTK